MNTEALSRTLLFLERARKKVFRHSDEDKLMKQQMEEITRLIIAITKRRMKLRGFEE